MRKFIYLFLVFSSLCADYTWLPTVPVAGPLSDAAGPSIAIDSNGNAVAVWQADTGPQLVIQAATKLYGQPWSSVQTISPPLEDAGDPLVVVDPNGNAVAVWSSSIGGSQVLRSASKLFNQPWAASLLIPTVVNPADFDTVIDMNGLVTLIWYEENLGVFTVYASEKSLFGGWTSPELLSGASTGALFPQVGIDSRGNVIGTWEDSQNIVAALKPFGGSWELPSTTIIGTGTSFAPQISVNPQGDAIVIAAGTGGVATAFKPFNQPWQPFETIPGSSTSPNSSPVIALDSHDNACAFWNSLINNLDMSTKFAGQPWIASTTFATGGSSPVINISPCDLVLLAWAQSGATSVSSGMIGGPFSAPFNIGGFNIGPPGGASVAQNPCGHAMVLSLFSNPNPVGATEGFLLFSISSFSGIQKKNDFGTLSEYENHLRWTTTTTGSIASFLIFRDGQLIAKVKGNKRKYVDPDRAKGVSSRYTIAEKDSDGNISAPVDAIIP